MKHTLFLSLIIAPLFTSPLRQALPVEDASLIYYLEFPKSEGEFPLIVAIEGSFVQNIGPQSVQGWHAALSPHFREHGLGIMTMEKRGIDGDEIDEVRFHAFNIPTQRLNDHLQLIGHIKKHPPENWDGRLIYLGGSEGGPIAIRLAALTDPNLCIAISGCSDEPLKELIWTIISEIKNEVSGLPETKQDFERQIAQMRADPDPTRFWLGQSYRYWADAIEQSEATDFLSLNCPSLVISGSEDFECPSTDRLVCCAEAQGQDVTYIRVEGMDHSALDPKWDLLSEVSSYIIKRLNYIYY